MEEGSRSSRDSGIKVQGKKDQGRTDKRPTSVGAPG